MRFNRFTFIGIFGTMLLATSLQAQHEVASLYLKFHTDKIYVLDNQRVEFTASIILGQPDAPAKDIYALSFDVIFDADLVLADATTFVYNTSSFLGSAQEVAILEKGQAADKGILQVTINRLGGKNVSGFGEIGQIRFITVGDIIGSRAGESTPFHAKVIPLHLLNADGEAIPIETDEAGDTVILINDILALQRASDNRFMQVYPNPAGQLLQIQFNTLQTRRLELFNATGQRVHMQTVRSNRAQISTAGFLPGLYVLKVHTETGYLVKQIMIQGY